MKKLSKTTTQQELIDKINKAADIIHKSSLNSYAQYIIVSPKIAEAIENLNIKILRKKKLKAIFESQ